MKNNNIDMVSIPRDILESIFKAMHKAEYCHLGREERIGDYEDYGNEILIHERCFTPSSPEWKAVKKTLKNK